MDESLYLSAPPLRRKHDTISSPRSVRSRDLRQLHHDELTGLDVRGDGGLSTAKALSPILSHTSSLEVLYMSGNKIGVKGAKELSQSINSNSKLELKDVSLKDNKLGNKGISEILPTLSKQTSLHTLDLSKNRISSDGAGTISFFLERSASIEALDLSGNEKLGKSLEKVCDGLQNNNCLRTLSLRSVGLTKKNIAPLIVFLRLSKTLTTLDLSFNNLGTDTIIRICAAIPDSQSLSELAIAGNKMGYRAIDHIVTKVLMNPRIKSLDISDNKIGKEGVTLIAGALTTHQHLRILKLTDARLGPEGGKILLQSLAKNTSIFSLDVSRNKFTDKIDIPLVNLIRTNTTLQSLVLAYNKLEVCSLGKFMQDNATLTSLDLSGNPVRPSLCADLFHSMDTNTTLVHLNFSNCQLKKDSANILAKLYMKSLTIKTMPVNSTTISTKDFAAKGLTRFPAATLSMIHLRVLNLSHNKLSEIPSAISDLIHLKEFDVSHNVLEGLPCSLVNISGLRSIRVEGNPLRVPPPEVWERGKTKDILGYLSDLDKGAVPCFRGKLMVVGQENVGKTTLMTRLFKKESILSSKNSAIGNTNLSTDGIDISDWTIKVTLKNKDGKTTKQPITFSTWDFAGQEIYYSSHQFFLSERSVFLLAFDLRYPESESRVEFWLESIRARARHAPVIIVGTHADDPKCTEHYLTEVLEGISAKYCGKFPNIQRIVSIDATKNVSNLKKIIQEVTAGQPWVGELTPKTYIQLEELLIEERKNRTPPIITWKEWCKLAVIAQITDKESLSRATKFLHNVGNLIHFEDKSSNLGDIVVLHPKFICDLLASIVTTKHRFVKGGILHRQDLDQIWKDPTMFPQDMFDTFTSMLEKFEVMHPLSRDTDKRAITWIIPTLLPSDEPELSRSIYADLPIGSFAISRKFQLDFMPSGLFSRFLIRMLQFSGSPLQYWSGGAVIRDEQNFYMLKLFPESQSIGISVAGKYPEEKACVVMEILRNLVVNWYHLPLQEEVPCPNSHEDVLVSSWRNGHFIPLRIFKLKAATHTLIRCPTCDAEVPMRCHVPDVDMTVIANRQILFPSIHLGKELGTGAFGKIYVGTLGEVTAAIKILNVEPQNSPEFSEEDAIQVYDEFRSEVLLMSRLFHPNVINLIGYSLDPLAIVMEMASHGNLYQFLHDGKQSIPMGMRHRIARDIASGMSHLHSFVPPFIHRDLKSPNILLASKSENASEVAKISDFGTSKQMHLSTLIETKQTRVVQLPTWLAPEVVAGEEYTEKSDIYAFGIIVWELMTRKHPFESYTWMAEMEDAIIAGIRPPIPSDCHPGFADLMRRCWDGDADHRPSFVACLEILKNIKT